MTEPTTVEEVVVTGKRPKKRKYKPFEALLENPRALLQGAQDAGQRFHDYVASGRADQDVGRLAEDPVGAVRRGVSGFAANIAEDFREDPLKAAAGLVPFVGSAVAARDASALREQAEEARLRGDEDTARRLEELAAITAGSIAAGVLPAGRAVAKSGIKAIERGAARDATRLAEKYGVGEAPSTMPAPAILRNHNLASDVLAEAARKDKGVQSFADWRASNDDKLGTLFDYSRLSEVPDVPQTQMPRYVPPRGPSARIVDVLNDPRVVKGLNATVERGAENGALGWYNTNPLLDRLRSTVGDIDGPSLYARLMDTVAASSPKAKVADNIRMASYYNYLRANGLPIPDKPAGGYGSVSQNLHVSNVRGLEDIGGWDIFKNPKPASFSTNLQGNQNNVTIDTHNMRLPGYLSQDPRMLAPNYDELIKPAKGETVIDRNKVAEDLMAKYPNMRGSDLDEFLSKLDRGKVTYKPRDWVASGSVSMDEALQQPTFWDSKPKDNEYGYYEAWQQGQAKKMGMSPAQYQASMWLGGADETGLGSAPEPFLKTFEARVRYTADRLGLPPDVVLEEVLKGTTPLLAKGGLVEKYDA